MSVARWRGGSVARITPNQANKRVIVATRGASIVAPYAIAPGSLPAATVGLAYGPIAINGVGASPASAVALAGGELPPGLILWDGKISGTPTTAGVFPFTLRAFNAAGGVTADYSITVA